MKTNLPELIAQIDGVNIGDGVRVDARHPVGGRTGAHIIAAFDGIVPVAQVFSFGGSGSQDGGPEFEITEQQQKLYAKLFASAPDFALMLAGFASGVLRWQRWDDKRGELCISGMRHATRTDAFGCPILTAAARDALIKI